MPCCGYRAHQKARMRMFASPAPWDCRSITLSPMSLRGSALRREDAKPVLIGIERHKGVAKVHGRRLLQNGKAHGLPAAVKPLDFAAVRYMEAKLGATTQGSWSGLGRVLRPKAKHRAVLQLEHGAGGRG